MIDSETLIKRNQNVLRDILDRHELESKRTRKFLEFALGNGSKTPGESTSF